MTLAGYAGSEIGNKYPQDPKVLNKVLGLRGLTICRTAELARPEEDRDGDRACRNAGDRGTQ
jgi:inosose dehydratase